MLQLVNSSNEDGRHGDSNAPPTQRARGNAVRNSRQVVRNNNEGAKRKVDRRENEREGTRRKISKIPVIQPSPRHPARAGNGKTATGLKPQAHNSKTERNARNSKMANQRVREEERSLKMAAVVGRPLMERSVSPPIPVVGKRLREQKGHAERGGGAFSRASRNDDEFTHFVRSDSPPVPVVAKMLRKGEFSGDHVTSHVTEVVRPTYERAPSPPVPAVARKLRDVGGGQEQTLTNETIPPVSYERTQSPPIPTVAKRLRNQEIDQDLSRTHTITNYHNNDRGASPPVPAVVKRLHQEHVEKVSDSNVKSKSAPAATLNKERKKEKMNDNSDSDLCVYEIVSSSDSEKGQFEINRAPSCDPDSKPLSPVTMTATSLPSIATATSNHHHDNPQPMVPPQSSNRQRLILQQLTMLKEGILTQQNSIDNRVQTILTRNKQCNF